MPPTICVLSHAEFLQLAQADLPTAVPPLATATDEFGDRNTRLQAFIGWALAAAYSGRYSYQDSLLLLCRAREALKLLEQLQCACLPAPGLSN